MKPNRFVTPFFIMALLALLPAPSAFAAIFLKTSSPDIKGNATFQGYEDQIIIMSINTGGLNPGCSGGAGQPSLNEVSFTKVLDPATVDFLTAFRDRTLVGGMEFVIAIPGGGGGVYVETKRYTFDDVIFTSYGTSDDEIDAGFEVWTLSFGRATVTYTEYDQAGNPMAPESVTITPGNCVGN